MNISLSPFAPENLVSRDGFGRPVPRQSAHFPHLGWIWYLLKGFLTLFATASIYTVNSHRVNPEFMRPRNCADGVHYRESADTGSAVPNVVRVTGAAFSFSTPSIRTTVDMVYILHDRADHPISYLDTLIKTGSESIVATLCRRRIFFCGICGTHGGCETAEVRDVRRNGEGRGLCGGAGKRVDGVFPGRFQSFRHQRRPVDDCSPGRGGMA